jgi:hypothetical protein
MRAGVMPAKVRYAEVEDRERGRGEESSSIKDSRQRRAKDGRMT